MSVRRILLIAAICALWALIMLPIWYIGLGYEGVAFRLPSPNRDRVFDLFLFYTPIVLAAWLATKPLRQRLNRNAANQ
jgi:hypothetical protein